MSKNNKSKKSRKALVSAGVFFGVAAIASVTFAAFVVGSNTLGSTEANVTGVGVNDGTVNIELTYDNVEKPLVFGPSAASYSESRVYSDNGDSEENLTATITYTITVDTDSASLLQTLSSFEIETTAALNSGAEGEDVVAAGYISLPEENTTVDLSIPEGSNTYSGSAEVTFSWGDEFGNVNPSVYYDSDGEYDGKDTGESEIKSELEAFETALANTTFTFTATNLQYTE